MAAGATYEPIATTTLGSAQASVTFSSLGSYTDIVAIVNVKNTVGAGYWLQAQFNGFTSNQYSTTVLQGNGSAASSYRYSNESDGVRCGATYTSNFTPAIINILNYSNSTTFKTVLSRFNDGGNTVQALVGLFRQTGAITSIKFQIEAGTANIASGSTFTLYGIAAA
jgi:hypothetical protein